MNEVLYSKSMDNIESIDIESTDEKSGVSLLVVTVRNGDEVTKNSLRVRFHDISDAEKVQNGEAVETSKFRLLPRRKSVVRRGIPAPAVG